MEMIQTKAELIQHLEQVDYSKTNFEIAVEALIFNEEAKLVLLLRGPGSRDAHYKLEGIGGRVNPEEEDLHQRLQREIGEEIASPRDPRVTVEVGIEDLLEIRQVQFQDAKAQKVVDWVVVSFLCRLVSGIPVNNEIDKHLGVYYLSLDELFGWPEEPVTVLLRQQEIIIRPGLSRSLVMGREAYRKKYGNLPYYETS